MFLAATGWSCWLVLTKKLENTRAANLFRSTASMGDIGSKKEVEEAKAARVTPLMKGAGTRSNEAKFCQWEEW